MGRRIRNENDVQDDKTGRAAHVHRRRNGTSSTATGIQSLRHRNVERGVTMITRIRVEQLGRRTTGEPHRSADDWCVVLEQGEPDGSDSIVADFHSLEEAESFAREVEGVQDFIRVGLGRSRH